MGVGVYYSRLRRDGLGDGFGIRGSLDRPAKLGPGEWSDLWDELSTAIAEIGGSAENPFSRRRAAFDSDMALLGKTRHAHVGIREWQLDYVVEVAGGSQTHEWLSDTEWYEKDIRDACGLSQKAFRDLMPEYHRRLARYLRLWMQSVGGECYALSGGYVSIKLLKPADRMLAAEIKRLRDWLIRRNRELRPAPVRRAA